MINLRKMNLTRNLRPSINSGLRNLQFPQISRIISRTSLFIKSFGGQARGISIFTLLRILGVAIVCASFLIYFSDQNVQSVNRIDALEKAVSLKPSDFNKRLRLALSYEEEFKKTSNLQNLEKALEEAKVAQQLDPQNLNAQRLILRLNKENSAEIKKEIQQVATIVKNRPDYQAAWLKLAALYEKLGDEKNAHDARNRAKLLNQNF